MHKWIEKKEIFLPIFCVLGCNPCRAILRIGSEVQFTHRGDRK